MQLLRHDAQLLAVDRRPQRAVRQADAGDAEGGQSAAEDQPLPGLHAGRDDRYQGRRAVPVRRPGQQQHRAFARLFRDQPRRWILWL